MEKLAQLRNGIDEIDEQLVHLLAQRFKLTEEVGEYKASLRLDPQDASREALQFEKIARLSARQGLNPEYAAAIYRRIMDVVISRHKELAQFELKEV